MAGGVVNISVNTIPTFCNRIMELATQAHSEWNSVYEEVGNLKTSWTGTDYNQVAKTFNENANKIKKMFDYLGQKVPEACYEYFDNLVKTMNNGEGLTGISSKSFAALPSLDTNTSTEELVFDYDKIATVKASIESHSKKIASYLSDMKSETDTLKAKNSGQSISKIYQPILSAITSSAATMDTLIRAYTNNSSEMALKLGAAEALESAVQAAQSAADAVLDTAASAIDAVSDAIGEGAVGLGEWLQSLGESLKD